MGLDLKNGGERQYTHRTGTSSDRDGIDQLRAATRRATAVWITKSEMESCETAWLLLCLSVLLAYEISAVDNIRNSRSPTPHQLTG
ncbi:hypothetical protein SAMN06296378_1759 [Salinibacterium xinjiangense]|uniref:Uncharacterized protein n=1 Tax=Salinibacterium xinjiangense TaxID=386302 RepID=A0A2C8ZN51_9MICO|nr:hypothetical protein SAMN06296378_1759 [Salinibacterium xinjiangense]